MAARTLDPLKIVECTELMQLLKVNYWITEILLKLQKVYVFLYNVCSKN